MGFWEQWNFYGKLPIKVPLFPKPLELQQASRTTKDSRESELGKAPDTAIQINNNGRIAASVSTMTRADRERRLAELMGLVG